MVSFIELEGFGDDWKDLGLTDDDLMALQLLIMSSPRSHPVIGKTGGLRKMRFAPLRWRRGKRGAVRVCYVYLEEHAMILQVLAYSKREKDDLWAAERKAIHRLIDRIKRELDERTIR